MKRVLVTGASGTLGLSVVKYLLAEGKYEVTALDLKNKGVYHHLKKYRKRVNIVYGDILDSNLIEKLIKDVDVVIHLASCLPPICDYYKDISKIIEVDGTETIIKAISYYNPKCYLIYGSTTSMYGDDTKVGSKIKIDNLDDFSLAKYNAEELIKESVKNYTILRLPLIMGDFNIDNFIYSINPSEDLEVITKEDASTAVISCINNYAKVNRKTFNIGGGENCREVYRELLNKILHTHGYSHKFFSGYILSNKTYRSPFLEDTSKSNEILNYQNDSLNNYFKKQSKLSSKRKVRKVIGGLFISKKNGKAK